MEEQFPDGPNFSRIVGEQDILEKPGGFFLIHKAENREDLDILV